MFIKQFLSGKVTFALLKKYPMNKLTILFVFFLFVQELSAQQLPLFAQYRENYIAINPAMVSGDYLLYEHTLSFGASYRSQWREFEGSPETQFVRGEYLYDNGSFGLLTGGYIMNDQTGPTGFTGIYGRLGAIFTEDPYYGGFAVGLSLGGVQYRVDVTELRLRDENDIVATDDKTQFYPDVGLGLYYYKRMSGGFFDDDYFYAGLSLPQAFGLNLEFQDDGGNFSLQRMRHFYAQAGLFHLMEEDSFLELAAWAKYVQGAPVNVDVNLRYQTNANIWIGVGGSTAGTAHVELGVLVGENVGFNNNLRIGYGFDYTFSSFGPSVGTTHEVNISYSIYQQ